MVFLPSSVISLREDDDEGVGLKVPEFQLFGISLFSKVYLSLAKR